MGTGKEKKTTWSEDIRQLLLKKMQNVPPWKCNFRAFQSIKKPELAHPCDIPQKLYWHRFIWTLMVTDFEKKKQKKKKTAICAVTPQISIHPHPTQVCALAAKKKNPQNPHPCLKAWESLGVKKKDNKHTLALGVSMRGPMVRIIWHKHSRSSDISLSWEFFFFSNSCLMHRCRMFSCSISSLPSSPAE